MSTGEGHTSALVSSYLAAKRFVIEAGHLDEIVWQQQVTVDAVTRVDFFREAAWVVLCAGMRERVVASVFPELTVAFHNWQPERVVADPDVVRGAMRIFGHDRKIHSIARIGAIANALDDGTLQDLLRSRTESFLRSLPYVGPVTWRHLAKNLGASVCKADRHLERIASRTHRASVDELCHEISAWLAEPVEVVDVVLWRWSLLHDAGCGRVGCDEPLPVTCMQPA